MSNETKSESRRLYLGEISAEKLTKNVDVAGLGAVQSLAHIEGKNLPISKELFEYYKNSSLRLPGFEDFFVRCESEQTVRLCWLKGSDFISRLLTLDESFILRSLFSNDEKFS